MSFIASAKEVLSIASCLTGNLVFVGQRRSVADRIKRRRIAGKAKDIGLADVIQ